MTFAIGDMTFDDDILQFALHLVMTFAIGEKDEK